jgi:type IV pilus assembly protein PilA
MCKVFRKQEGFTLIELMIVVAIIGILAAIAIPNFLQYQLKSRQAEAKTNLGAIRTSLTAFQAERGCYVGVTTWPTTNVPAINAKNVPTAWSTAATPVPGGVTTYCQAVGGVFTTPATAAFIDVGFVATGSVLFNYGTQSIAAGGVTPMLSCTGAGFAANGAAVAPTPGAVGDIGFWAFAQSNLDGDNTISHWGASPDNGSQDCTVGTF